MKGNYTSMKIRNTAMLSIIAISVVTLSGYLFVPRAAGTRGLGIKGFGVRCGIYADLLWMCLGYLINTFFFKTSRYDCIISFPTGSCTLLYCFVIETSCLYNKKLRNDVDLSYL